MEKELRKLQYAIQLQFSLTKIDIGTYLCGCLGHWCGCLVRIIV